MSKKKKVKVQEQSSVALPWWKTARAKFTLTLLGTIVACATFILTYKTTGADELRARVYQPLFADIVSVEESVQAISAENPAVMKALPGLKRSGAFELIPLQTQRRIVKVSEDISTFHIAIDAVREIALREMSSRILKIRSKERDQIWLKKTERILREMSKSKKGISDSVTLLSAMKHEARSRAIDIRNPSQPEIAGPGGPTFVVRDWITYPGSIQIIEDLWTDVDYLYFNDRLDSWYYQLTREDLRSLSTNLTDFLRPVFQILAINSDFQLLLKTQPVLLMEVREIKKVLVDRIQDPKQIRDLILF